MTEVVIAGYLRTAQSRSRPNDPARDWFCKLRADELLAKILPELIKRVGIDPKEIDDLKLESKQSIELVRFVDEVVKRLPGVVDVRTEPILEFVKNDVRWGLVGGGDGSRR